MSDSALDLGIIFYDNNDEIPSPHIFQHKHPHIVFEAKSPGRQVCGNKRGLEYNMPSGISSVLGEPGRKAEDNSPKYFVELALLLDKAMVRRMRREEGSSINYFQKLQP